MTEVFTKGNPEFTVVDGVWGMGAFQRRTVSRFIHPTVTPEGEEYLRGIIRVIAALPTSGKTEFAEEDTEKWEKYKDRIITAYPKSGKIDFAKQDFDTEEDTRKLEMDEGLDFTNQHARMDWGLLEVRRRAGVLGMDYETQSRDYIMEAGSALMRYTLDCAVRDLRPPWKVNVEVVLAPFPLRNYMWSTLNQFINRLAEKTLERKKQNLPESVVVEFVTFTPNEPLYEKAHQDRRARRGELIRSGQSGAPDEIVSWIDDKTGEVIDKLIAIGQLPGVPKNYRKSYEMRAYAIRRLFKWYAYDMLGEHANTRFLSGINKLTDQPIPTRDPNAFKKKFSLPFTERAVELFGETGLGPFKPDTDKQRVRVKPPGMEWLATFQKA